MQYMPAPSKQGDDVETLQTLGTQNLYAEEDGEVDIQDEYRKRYEEILQNSEDANN